MMYHAMPRNRSWLRTDVQIDRMPSSPLREQVRMLYSLFEKITWAREASFMWAMLGFVPFLGVVFFGDFHGCDLLATNCDVNEAWINGLLFGSLAAFVAIGFMVYHFHYRAVEEVAIMRIKEVVASHPGLRIALDELAAMDASVESRAKEMFPERKGEG